MNIPELRKAFEHIEGFTVQHLNDSDVVPKVQEEWYRTFYKEIDGKTAEDYVEHYKTNNTGHLRLVSREDRSPKHRRGRSSSSSRSQRGGASPLSGAPIDYTTRPGLYPIPAGVNQDSYAQVPKYVQSGFWNPEPGRSYDPVPGQTRFPTETPPGMGSNSVASLGMKGGRRGHTRSRHRTHRKHRGGSILSDISQMLFRPFTSSVPTSIGQDAQTALNGQQLPASPDPTQTHNKYQATQPYSSSGTFNVSPINVNLKRDIATN